MKILADILHPAHVHFFKHFISQMKARGHTVIVTSRDKECTLYLLDKFGIQHTCLSKAKKQSISEFYERFKKLKKIVKEEKPDVLIGIHGVIIAPVGKLTHTPTYIFYDTEKAGLITELAFRLATKVIVPETFARKLKNKVTYKSQQKLAYLYDFVPKENPIKEKYFVLRFNAWEACHDKREKGFSIEQKRELIKYLSKFGKVLISSEKTLPDEFTKYQINCPPEEIHNLLYHAHLYIGDSNTMAIETGLLGTHSIRHNSLVDSMHGKGVFEELEKARLVHSFKNFDYVIILAGLLAQTDKVYHRERLNEYLKTKINLTDWMVNYFEELSKKNN